MALALAGCSPASSEAHDSACPPCSPGFANFAAQFQCPLAGSPSLSLTGPCEQLGSRADTPDGAPFPVIASTGAGTCHATLSLPDGTMYSTSVTFTAQASTCGCIEVEFDASAIWMIDNTCQ